MNLSRVHVYVEGPVNEDTEVLINSGAKVSQLNTKTIELNRMDL